MLSAPSLSLVEGELDADRDVTATARRLTLVLPAATTGALLTHVPAAFHGGINDVLLTGLAVALAQWCRGGGGAAAMRYCLMLRGTGGRRFFPTLSCRARWAGSPVFTRCGLTRGR